MHHRFLIPLALTVGVVAVSTAAPVIKLCEDAAPVFIAAARLGIATCVLAPVAAGIRGRKLFSVPRAYAGHILLSGLFLAAHFFFWITSLKHTSVMSSVVIVTMNPIFVGAASYVLFKERIGRRFLPAICLATAGAALIATSDFRQPQGPDSVYGDFMALCGAIMASCYFLVGRSLRPKMDTLSYVVPVYGVAAVVLIAFALGSGHRFTGYSQGTYVYVIFLALVPQLLGHSIFNWALRHVTATTLTVFLLGEPIGAALLAYGLLDESVRGLQVFGCALVLVGIVIAARSQLPRTPSTGP